MARRVLDADVDGASETESIVLAQSWQAWSITRESFAAGRTDLKAREVHFATYPSFAPTRAELETRARQCGFRYAMLQRYAASVGDRLKLINEDTELFDFSSSSVGDVKKREVEGQRDNSAQTINATADAIREAKELLRELTPEQRAEVTLTREDVADLINEAVAKLQQVVPVQEKSELARLRELMAFQRELQEQVAQRTPGRQSELSDKQRVELAMVSQLNVVPEMFKAMREALGTAERVDEPEGLTSQIVGVLKDGVLPYVMPVIAPSVGAKLVSLINRVDDRTLLQALGSQQQSTQAMPSQTAVTASVKTPSNAPAQSTAQAQEDDPIGAFVLNLKQDILEENTPDEAITDAVKIYFEHPEYQHVIVGVLGRTNSELLGLTQQVTGVDLSSLANANDFLDGLRNGVQSRLQPVDAVASSNGHRAAAEVKTAGEG